ncbi:MAG: mismatch-specific DNA-glycosylase, partial [Alphaproteobacteria bacterium]|nr:mismatch-specific DNA-glycosylase [Alphaproteobacteria bacterium]
MLPDILVEGLDVVFCGSAVGAASARLKAYYAGPANKLWPTLHRIGLTERQLAPREYQLVATYGIGLTDMNKSQSGGDAALSRTADQPDRLRRLIERYRPLVLAFNGKRAAAVLLGADVRYGQQDHRIGDTVIYVLPSTSGAAAGRWDLAPWQEMAEHIRHRRIFSRAEPDLARLTPEAKEDMRTALNRRLYHRIGLDLRKKRDESEFASRVVSPRQVERQRQLVAGTIETFLDGPASFLPADRTLVRPMVDDFFRLYGERPVSDNEGGIKLADSLWLFVLARLVAPTFVVESGSHRGLSSWLLRQACPQATIHCYDVSFRSLAWRDGTIAYHEQDWMAAPLQV